MRILRLALVVRIRWNGSSNKPKELVLCPPLQGWLAEGRYETDVGCKSMKITSTFITLVGLVALFAQGQVYSESLVLQPLMIGDKPINPLCLQAIADGLSPGDSTPQLTIHANNCPRPDIVNITAESNLEHGFAGFLFDFKDDSQILGDGSLEYRYVGELRGMSVVLLKFANVFTGNGFYTRLLSLKWNGDEVTFDLIDGGDRCLGGISNEKIENGHLYYDRSLTVETLMELSLTPKNKAFFNPVDSRLDCAATMQMRDSSWSSITLVPPYWVRDPQFKESKLERCFSKIHRKFIQTKNAELTPIKFGQFKDKLNACVARR